MKTNNFSPEEYSIIQLKNGDWRGTLHIIKNGSDDFITFDAPTKAEVLKMISSCRVSDDSPDDAAPQTLSFKAWAEYWYRSHQNKVQASTFAGYQFTLKLLVDQFGESDVTNISPRKISEYLLSLVIAGSSKSKIDKCRAMLFQIFALLVEKNIMPTNPVLLAHVKLIKKDGGILAFTEEEVGILFRELPSDKIGHSIRILLGCGLMVQELLALEPQDISYDGSTIHVRQAVKTVGGKAVVESLEDTYALRKIPVPGTCHSSAQFLRKNASGKYVFCKNDNVHTVGTFRHWYEAVIKDISYVRPLSPHCCQHTYAKLLESKGVTKGQIAHLLGHSDKKAKASSTQLSKESLQNAVERLNKVFTEHL